MSQGSLYITSVFHSLQWTLSRTFHAREVKHPQGLALVTMEATFTVQGPDGMFVRAPLECGRVLRRAACSIASRPELAWVWSICSTSNCTLGVIHRLGCGLQCRLQGPPRHVTLVPMSIRTAIVLLDMTLYREERFADQTLL